MIFGFDLDGVLCSIDMTLLQIVHNQGIVAERVFEQVYYSERPMLLSPELLLSKDDEYHVITGRHIRLEKITVGWCRKHCAGAKSINIVGGEPWYDLPISDNQLESWSEWNRGVSKRKIQKIKDLKVDVFIDDSPMVVSLLRKELPDVMVIQYGGRVGEY